MKALLKTFLFGVTLGVVTIFSSCEPEDSADVNQDRIYTDYELFYNENSDVSRLLASFRFGTSLLGTVLELEDPAGVTFNGREMPYETFLLGHSIEEAGQVTSGSFVYTNVDGEVLTNSLPGYNEIAFPSDLEEISKQSAFELVWEGPALVANEDVSVFVGGFDTEDALFFTDTDGATSIVLGRDELERLTLGENTFYMERALRVDPDETPEAGGRMRVRYRTENVTIVLTE